MLGEHHDCEPAGNWLADHKRTVGAFEAKTHLSKLLDDIESGETILIARHGRVIARSSPAERSGRRAVAGRNC